MPTKVHESTSDRKAGRKMTLQSSAPAIRSRVTFDEIDGLSITIPAKSDPSDFVARAIISGGGVVAALVSLSFVFLNAPMRTHDPHGSTLFPWLIMAFMFCLPCLVMGIRHWHAAGCREIIHLDGYHITLSSEGYAFPARQTRTLPLGEVRNLRYSPVQHQSSRGLQEGESIAFEWLGKTVRFGMALSEEESRRLIRTIKDYYKIPDDKDEPLPVERF
jgi:hypothetical protein